MRNDACFFEFVQRKTILQIVLCAGSDLQNRFTLGICGCAVKIVFCHKKINMDSPQILNFSSFSEQIAITLFDLQVQTKPIEAWNYWLELGKNIEVTDDEQKQLEALANSLNLYARGWNEMELRQKFIGPIINLVGFDNFELRVAYFAERAMQAQYDEHIIKGVADGIVATGIFDPVSPLFFVHEYKREKDNTGDAAGQLLASMRVADILNRQPPSINQFYKEEYPIPKVMYGLYIIGRLWFFISMKEEKYYISKAYDAGEINDLTAILQLLKAQKQIIFDFLAKEN